MVRALVVEGMIPGKGLNRSRRADGPPEQEPAEWKCSGENPKKGLEGKKLEPQKMGRSVNTCPIQPCPCRTGWNPGRRARKVGRNPGAEYVGNVVAIGIETRPARQIHRRKYAKKSGSTLHSLRTQRII